MKVLFSTACASKNAGGVFMTVSQLAQSLVKLNHEVNVLAVRDERGIDDLDEWRPVTPKLCSTYPCSLGYRPSFEMFQELTRSQPDIYHIHGLRTWPSLATRIVARRKNIPYVVSPHGQLDRWIMQKARLKKWIIHAFAENRTLGLANALHVTCEQEYTFVRDLGFRNPLILVPNGINIADYGGISQNELDDFWPDLRGRKVLLFLSLIQPKKGLDMLAGAWSQLCELFPDWTLVIAGSGTMEYEASVREMFATTCSRGQTLFVGACYGERKWALFSKCTVFILPTYTENFGNVVLEAMASRKPVITTKGAPWKCLEKKKAGWWVDVDQTKISDAIEEALSAPEAELTAMGERGYEYAAATFEWAKLSRKMADSYAYLAGQAPRPDCVFEC